MGFLTLLAFGSFLFLVVFLRRRASRPQLDERDLTVWCCQETLLDFNRIGLSSERLWLYNRRMAKRIRLLIPALCSRIPG
jgi:hypothetical protein